jgi:phosphoglycolate phosphatase
MPAIIAFDLDGTLVDTAPDLIDTLNAVFAQKGIPPVAFETARTMIGGGVKKLLERSLGAQGFASTPSEVDALFKVYLDHYVAHIADRSRPFPGLLTALDRLETQGFRFAVCTNKLEQLSIRLLDALDLSRRFLAVCGQDTFGVAKPNPKILRLTLERAGGSLADAVMVGDSETDIATAKAAGVPVVAVDFGYTETPVGELSPDRVISHFDDLPEAIAAVRSRSAGR